MRHFGSFFSTRMASIVVVQILTLFVCHQYQCHTTILRNLTFHPFPVHHGIALCGTIPMRDCISLPLPRAALQAKRHCSAMLLFCMPPFARPQARDYRSLRCRGQPCKQKGIAPQCCFFVCLRSLVRKRGIIDPSAAAGSPASEKALLRNAAFLCAAVRSSASGQRPSAHKKGNAVWRCLFACGERGIRTPGPVKVNGFQDRRDRPLRHLSGGKSTTFFPPLPALPKKFLQTLLYDILSYLCTLLCNPFIYSQLINKQRII